VIRAAGNPGAPHPELTDPTGASTSRKLLRDPGPLWER
jgi:hypothetical protein